MSGGKQGNTGKGGVPSRKSGDKHWLDYATTFFAFLAAGGGIYAAVVANNQLSVARDAEQQQLRAYVFVTGADLRDFGSEKPISIMIGLKNFGSTPAYELRRQTVVAVYDFPPGELREVSLAKDKTVLGPGGEGYLKPGKANAVLTAEQVSKIKAGRAAIYAYGAIRYRDAFDALRCTRFRLLFRGNADDTAADTPLQMEHAAEGNDSDENCEAIRTEQ